MQAFHPYFVDRLPYVVAVVELEEQAGLRMTSTIVDCGEGDLKVGLPVAVEFQEITPGLTLPVFRLVREESGAHT